MDIGQQVVLKDNPQKKGILLDKAPRHNRVFCKVNFDGQIQQFPEEYLKPYTSEVDVLDLSTCISKNMFNTPEDVRREITKIRLNGNLSDMIYSMGVTNTEFFAYQFKPVVKIINSASNSILIADEVGLGKTIEAGLIWTELKQRLNLKNLLIVCPGILREKWKNELAKKFGVKAEIVNAKDLIQIYKEKADYEETALICSLQGLRRKTVNGKEDLLKKFFEDIAEKGEKIIDLLIVDEAHYLRNPGTNAHKIIESVRDVSDHVVFLSATPVQNGSEDLASLVSLLDPFNFQWMKNKFDDILQINRPIIKLRDGLLADKLDKTTILNLIDEVRRIDSIGLFENSKQLKAIEQEIRDSKVLSKERLHYFAYEMDRINSLGYIINRTKKRDVQENRIIREAIPETIQMTEEEKEIYNKITKIIHDYAQQKPMAQFLSCKPQMMMSSCMYATLAEWEKRIYKFDYEDVDIEEEEEKENETNSSPFMEKIYAEVSKFKNLQQIKENDTKFKRLLQVINDIRKNYPTDKIVLFSTFIKTLKYLQERLKEHGINGILLHGNVKDKNEVLRQFENDPAQKILLSSEVGSEGVDLQFCRLLINYDLPWNPMRVEQRIGRLDRIGQKHKKILIWNMYHNSTIDARIYNKLYHKFEICTSALGDFEEVLGKEFKKLSIELLTMSAEEQEKLLEQQQSSIYNRLETNRRLEKEASQLAAYGDYILNEIQKAQNIDNVIKTYDIENYVIDTLNKFYKQTRISKSAEDHHYLIDVDSSFRMDFEEYCNKNRISRGSLFLNSFGNIHCFFTNNVICKNKGSMETINQTHPIISFLNEKCNNETNTQTAIIKVENSENKGFFIIGVSFVSIEGVTSHKFLLFNGKNIETGEKLTNEQAKKIAIEALNNGVNWRDRSNLDYANLGELANDIMIDNFELYETKRKDIEYQNYDKAEMQIATIKKYLEDQQAQVDEKNEKVRNNEKAEKKEQVINMNEKWLSKLKERMEYRIEKIEKNKTIHSDKKDICMILIKGV